MRMNDLHDVNDPLNFQHSEFWRSNPQFRLVPGHTGGGWSSYALDYAHPEVREYQLAFVRELLERYDPDGIELDWLRFQYNLKEKNGRCDEDAHFIDDFVRNVRQLVDEWSKKRGREIKLGVRVPSNPDASDARGLKAVHWAKEAWIDWIVASTDWGVTDFDIRFDHWKERLGPEAAERVILLGGAERLTSAYPGAKNVVYDVPALYGFADNARFRGADGVYLFNWFDGGAGTPPESSYRRLLDGGFSCDFLVEQERRYPLCFRNIAPAGLPNAAQLPRETDKPVTVRILAGKAVQPGKAVLVLGFEKRDGLDAAAFSLSCNGKSLDAPEEEKGLTRLGSAPARALRFSCPSGDVRAGDNDIVLTQTKGEKQRLVWVELRVLP